MSHGLDAVSKRILDALVEDPRADVETLAAVAKVSPEVVRARVDRLQSRGVVRGFGIRLDAGMLGCPHEVLVAGAPTAHTTRGALEQLCTEPGVTRVFTLASRDSVAFTVCGAEVDATREKALGLAKGAGLTEPKVTLIVDVLHDDPTGGLHRAWQEGDVPRARQGPMIK